jgi:hypothetical protein
MILSKFQVTGFKQVIWIGAAQKRGTPRNEGISLDVIENTCRKNVSSLLSLDVNEKKVLIIFSEYVDEKSRT